MKKLLAAAALAVALVTLAPSVAFADSVITGDPLGGTAEVSWGGQCGYWGDQISTPGNGTIDFAATVVAQNCRTGARVDVYYSFTYQVWYQWTDGLWRELCEYTSSGIWFTAAGVGSIHEPTIPVCGAIWAHGIPMFTAHIFAMHLSTESTWHSSSWGQSPNGVTP